MPRFGRKSSAQLRTLDVRLQKLFREVVKRYDCSILTGYRGERAQNAAFDSGASKLRFPDGNHNEYPSKAADVAPYPIEWGGPLVRDGALVKPNLQAILRFYHFTGYVRGVAETMGIKIRCGCDWDGDFDFFDQTFNDLVHFELED